MCRFVAYQGEPILLEDVVTKPANGLTQQALHAREGNSPVNGDGVGLGWYGERAEPAVYREAHPAWTDENFMTLAAQVRSGLFFGHVRAATGTAAIRTNCHPFTAGRYLFVHEGQVGDWPHVRRRVEAMIPDRLHSLRAGTTDSEALFLAALGRGLDHDPVAAFAAVLAEVRAEMDRMGRAAPLRFAAALSDGQTMWGFRWASDEPPPALYYRERQGGLVLATEPIDDDKSGWAEVPPQSALIARRGRTLVLRALREPAEVD